MATIPPINSNVRFALPDHLYVLLREIRVACVAAGSRTTTVSSAELARNIRASAATVRRYAKSLVDRGLISIRPNGQGKPSPITLLEPVFSLSCPATPRTPRSPSGVGLGCVTPLQGVTTPQTTERTPPYATTLCISGHGPLRRLKYLKSMAAAFGLDYNLYLALPWINAGPWPPRNAEPLAPNLWDLSGFTDEQRWNNPTIKAMVAYNAKQKAIYTMMKRRAHARLDALRKTLPDAAPQRTTSKQTGFSTPSETTSISRALESGSRISPSLSDPTETPTLQHDYSDSSQTALQPV